MRGAHHPAHHPCGRHSSRARGWRPTPSFDAARAPSVFSLSAPAHFPRADRRRDDSTPEVRHVPTLEAVRPTRRPHLSVLVHACWCCPRPAAGPRMRSEPSARLAFAARRPTPTTVDGQDALRVRADPPRPHRRVPRPTLRPARRPGCSSPGRLPLAPRHPPTACSPRVRRSRPTRRRAPRLIVLAAIGTVRTGTVSSTIESTLDRPRSARPRAIVRVRSECARVERGHA